MERSPEYSAVPAARALVTHWALLAVTVTAEQPVTAVPARLKATVAPGGSGP